MPTLNETNHAGGFILSEANGNRSRRNGKLNAGQSLQAATVLGILLSVGAAVAGTNTGAGVVTLGAVGPDAQPGVYTLRCVAAAAGAGTFNLIAPDGTLVRQVTVGGGLAPNDHVAVTIADGDPDFAVNDTFTFEVSGGDYEQLDLSEDDGVQTAAGILYAGVDASAADAACVVIARDAEVIGADLVWPAGITDAQKAGAIASLASRGIIVR